VRPIDIGGLKMKYPYVAIAPAVGLFETAGGRHRPHLSKPQGFGGRVRCCWNQAKTLLCHPASTIRTNRKHHSKGFRQASPGGRLATVALCDFASSASN